MIVRKAFKYKLKTNRDIENKLSMMAGCCRLIWNKALAINLDRLAKKLPLLWYNEQAYWLTFWKSTEELSFLKECHSQPLQQTLRNLEKAFKDAFDKKQTNKRIPRFKRKGQGDSFRFPQGFKLDKGRVYLPKMGWVGYFNSRQITGKPKNITVSRHADSWYISVQVEQDINPVHPSDSIVGIDRGIVKLAALSDKMIYDPVSSTKKYAEKLATAQRRLKNKTSFSANWKKQQRKIAKIHRKIAYCRNDRLHWISNQISKNHAIIVLEDLKVKNMSASAKGTIENPGKNVAAKAGLNKAILDQGWSMFASMIEYKQLWRGGQVVYVPPHYTSQTCPCCSHKDKDNRKTQSRFKCTACQYENNADIVGALNVLARGHRVLACGETALADSVKQELNAA
ncbi:MAG: transposase [Nitrosopumilus sp.]|nr:transposase [Nitrosopumilus sp.]MDH5727396.1 transposase [Gammaproteobacteria bacterium]